MTKTRAVRWAAALAVLACAAPGLSGAEDAKVSGDLKKMQGTWVNAGNDAGDHHWVIAGETLKARVNGGNEYTCSLALDPKALPLPSVDFLVKEGPAEAVGKSAKGVYKFDGDLLIFCIALPGADARPAEFRTVEKEFYVIELKPET